MARLWSSGFELQSVTAGVEFDSSNSTGTKSISTAVKRSGAASLRLNPSAAYWFLGHQYRSNATTSKVYARFYLYAGTLPGGSVSIFAFAASTTGGNSGAQLKLNADGTLQLGYYDGSWHDVGSPSSALIPLVWYRIEVSYDDSNANNTITARLEGVEFASGNGGNLGGNGCIQLGALFDSSTMDINFDDVAVNDESGSYQTSFPGEGRIIHLNTSASGDNSSWTASTGNAWDCIDETPPSDTDYIDTSTLNAISDFNVSDSGLDSNVTVSLVSVGARHRNGTASATSAYQLRVKKAASGTVSATGDIIPNTTTASTHTTAAPHVYQLNTYVDPDSSAWTKTTLDSMQVGVKETVDSTQTIRITKLWALVEYINSSISSIVDAFTDNSVDTAIWNTFTQNSGTIAETNSRTEYYLAATTDQSWSGRHSVFQFNLVGSSIYVHCPSATTGNSWLDLTLSLEPLGNPENFISIGLDVGRQMLQVIKEISGSDTTITETAYNPLTMSWWKIRESGGTIYWEYAATQGGSYTTLYSTATLIIPITNLIVILDDFEYDALSTPNTHVLDNLNTPDTVTTKTVTGLSRITASATKTETGVSRITATTTRTESGIARITKTTSRTITGVANIVPGNTTTPQTISGKSRITKTVTQTESGKARITKTSTQTTTGLSRIQNFPKTRTNLIVNPSFEINITDGWSNFASSGTPVRSYDTSVSYYGGASYKHDANGIDTDSGLSSNFTLTPGIYRLSGVIKTQSMTGDVKLVLRNTTNYNADINLTLGSSTPTRAFTLVTGTYTVTATGGYDVILGIGPYGTPGKGTAWFDGIILEKIESATQDEIYFDGSRGGEWTGTTHNSTSTWKRGEIRGISRITTSTSQSTNGKGRITATSTKTITGISRIGLITSKTITGLSRITKSVAKTIQGVSRITASTTKTIQGISRITKTSTQTITGKANIVLTSTTQNITGKSRVQTTVTQTITGKGRIGLITVRTKTGISRITKSVSQTIAGLSRITTTTANTVTGKARIEKTVAQIIIGISRIELVTSKSISGVSRITASTTQTISGKSRITVISNQTISGKSNIISGDLTTSRTISGKASILSTISQQKRIILVDGEPAILVGGNYYTKL